MVGVPPVRSATIGNPELETLIPLLFAAIIGSISFWGSNIAFGKLQELIPGRPIAAPRPAVHQPRCCSLVAVGCAVAIASRRASRRGSSSLILVAAAILGNMLVLPIGGADMPVVISLLNAFTGLSAAAAGIALDNTALIVAGMLVGASGSILTNLMAEAMNRSIPNIVAGGFGGVPRPAGGGRRRRPRPPCARPTPATSAIQLAYADAVVVAPGLRHGRGAGPAHRARARRRAGEARRRGELRHPPRRRAACRGT